MIISKIHFKWNDPKTISQILFVSAILLAAGCTKTTTKNANAKVERKDLVQRVTVSGTVASARQTVVQVSFEGYVKKLYVTMGEKVKKDQPLVTVVQSLAS